MKKVSKLCVLFCFMLLALATANQKDAIAQNCQGWNTCLGNGCAPGNTTLLSTVSLCDDWIQNGQYMRCCGRAYSRNVTNPSYCTRQCTQCGVGVYANAEIGSCPTTGFCGTVNGGVWAN